MPVKPLLERLRWWWWAGAIWSFGYIGLLSLFSGGRLRRWIFGGATSWRLVAFLVPILIGVAWLVVVAPIIDARSRAFTDRRPAARRAWLHRVLAIAPSVIFGLLLIQFAIVMIVGIDHYGWLSPGYGVVLGGAFLLSIYYARMSKRNLDRALRKSAREAGVCYACNYVLVGQDAEGVLVGQDAEGVLVGQDADRCPECGAPVGG